MSLIKKTILIFFSFTIIFLIKVEPSFANQKVSEIRIEGNLRFDRETILKLKKIRIDFLIKDILTPQFIL